jgi:hypothetical protein
MDKVSLTIITVGFLAMLTCTTLVAYQNIRIAQIQQYTIELIARTHGVPTPRGN